MRPHFLTKSVNMKKILLSVAVLALGFAASAQTEKGRWLVGGNAGFTSTKSPGGEGSSSTVSNFSINPTAGYFVADNVAAGAGIGFTSATGGYSSIAATPFVRYYFLPIGDNAKLFANGAFGFGSVKPNSGASSSSFTAWEISAGPAFFLTKSVALETVLAYGQQKPKGVSATKEFGVKVGFQILLGGK